MQRSVPRVANELEDAGTYVMKNGPIYNLTVFIIIIIK
jgi:hypothetical protein